MPKAKRTNTIDIDHLAKLLGLPKLEDIEERNSDYIMESGGNARDEALEEAKRFDYDVSDEDLEEIEMKGQERAQDDVYRSWHNGVESAAEYLFDKHGLILEPIYQKGKGGYLHEFKILPIKSWEDAAHGILNTINGVGDFFFDSLEDFLDSGPYTAREAVLAHLGYISDYPRVYGDRTARSLFDSSFR
jgi:hypothetical protein